MPLFITRAGSAGQYERKFLDDGRIYFTWEGLGKDLNSAPDLKGYYAMFGAAYSGQGKGRIDNWARQGYQFCRIIKVGDWVVLPSKFNPTLNFGKVLGPCEYDPKAPEVFQNFRRVEWFAQDVPRARFDRDILHSFGAFLTVCQITRNNAEERVKEMAGNGWKVPAGSKAQLKPATESGEDSLESEDEIDIDLEATAYEQIARLIVARFKGHGLASLVRAILESEGYTVFQPPEGPDKGVDLLAAPGGMGFGQPRLCVQVKSQESPIERVVLDQLIGTMQNHRAENGLLVSWGGFKQTIERERAAQFFRVRLWNRDDVIRALLANYDKLDPTIKAELPLKRLWIVASDDDSEA